MIDDDFELKEIILSASHPAMSYCWIGVMDEAGEKKEEWLLPHQKKRG